MRLQISKFKRNLIKQAIFGLIKNIDQSFHAIYYICLNDPESPGRQVSHR